MTKFDPNPDILHTVEWIFGYGSLMWRPGFAFLEQKPATLPGYRRRPCIYSRHHRGTADRPGLVLGLDAGDGCTGVAFRIDINKQQQIFDYLHEREMIGYAYRPCVVDIELPGRSARAYTFVADTAHPGYAGSLSEEVAAEIIIKAAGISGLNRDYLINTVEKLAEHGVAEPELTSLLSRIQRMTGELEIGGGI